MTLIASGQPLTDECDRVCARHSNRLTRLLACLFGLVYAFGSSRLAYTQAAFDCTVQTEIPVAECQALVDLYSNTSGNSWSNSTGWQTTDTPCSWYGVSCNFGHVSSLSLVSNGLVGSIPESIGNLSRLVSLDLGMNGYVDPDHSLTGNIPDSIGNLSDLRELRLSFNNLTGPIPESVGNLSELYILQLEANSVSGTIPESVGNLGKLYELQLDGNQLTGPIPESLCNLNPWGLYLYGNSLTGDIPECLGRMVNARELVLGFNQLTGSIPESIGKLPNLIFFHAGGNALTGPIPPTIGNLAAGQSAVYLQDNQLEGTVPLSVAQIFDCTLTNNPDLCVPDIGAYQALATDGKVCGLPLDPQCDPIVHVEAKAILEGPYSRGIMRVAPMFSDHCPAAQPYADPIFDGTPLDCDHPDVVFSPPDSVIDWVLVSLRTGVSHESEVADSEHPAFLLANGSIVDTTGRILSFPGIAPDPYRLVVRHRNHASVMSADTLGLSDGFDSWDFTTSMSQAYSSGGAPMKQLHDGRFGMFACDVTVDGQIATTDFLMWQAKTSAGASGYEQADCNLDGYVTAPDFNLWNANTSAGASSQVPD